MKQEEKFKEAKMLYKTANADQKYVLESLFPELKESEGERMLKFIKKQLFNIKKTITENYELDAKLTMAIEWLEKQGESIKIKKGKNYLCTKTHKYAGVEWIEGVKYYSPEDYSLVNQECKYYCPKYSKEEHNNFFKEVEYDGCLEKQGEQKVSYTTLVETGNGGINALDTRELPTNCDSIYCSGCINKKGCINCENGDMKETEHKVEPNFHEGDWVVYNNDICQIVKREEGCNKLVTVFGIEKELVNERNLSTARLWTIQDAKDGDVLYSLDSNRPFIFKYRNPNEQATAYCGINKFGKFFVWNTQDCIITLDKYVPATKEQRDQLEKAMADAGYTFDFEKKELKKIEDEEYNGEDYGIDSLFHAQRILEKTLGKVEGYQTDDGILSHKCAITAVKKLYGQKPADWTDEDEELLQHCCGAVAAADYYTIEDKEEMENWLKTIKQRMEE